MSVELRMKSKDVREFRLNAVQGIITTLSCEQRSLRIVFYRLIRAQ